MNIYDIKSIHCANCGKFLGEINFDAQVFLPKCGRCSTTHLNGFETTKAQVTADAC
jgi:phage FluMu protein Com